MSAPTWFLILHVFFDDGLEIIKLPEPYQTEAACERAARRQSRIYRVPVATACLPINTIPETKGHIA